MAEVWPMPKSTDNLSFAQIEKAIKQMQLSFKCHSAGLFASRPSEHNIQVRRGQLIFPTIRDNFHPKEWDRILSLATPRAIYNPN